MNIFFIFAFSKINLLFILNSTSTTELLLLLSYPQNGVYFRVK